MGKYRVLIAGENLLLDFEGRPQKLGFYVSRTVDAPNYEGAESAAVDLIREDSRLEGLLNEIDDPPVLYAEEVKEIEASDTEQNTNTGFSWFPIDKANQDMRQQIFRSNVLGVPLVHRVCLQLTTDH